MIKVLVLNGSLKHGSDISNTQEVTDMVLAEMGKLSQIEASIIRLADKNIPVGLKYKESEDDEWPDIVEQITNSDVIIFATPI